MIDITQVTEDKDPGPSPELSAKYSDLRKKRSKGEDLTIAEMKTVIEYSRAVRCRNFTFKSEAQIAKENKPKKLSRANLILLQEKLNKGEELEEKENANYRHTLELYKGIKLSKKALAILQVKDFTEDGLNPIEKIDLEKNCPTPTEDTL